MRQLYLRQALYPIQVTDKETGIVYEVQSDRRTIIATSPDRTLLWKVSPFEDAKLKRYRLAHPFIVKIWRPKNPPHEWGDYLTIYFTGGQQGNLDLVSGHYTFIGQD